VAGSDDGQRDEYKNSSKRYGCDLKHINNIIMKHTMYKNRYVKLDVTIFDKSVDE
jgi:hypothetical protein